MIVNNLSALINSNRKIILEAGYRYVRGEGGRAIIASREAAAVDLLEYIRTVNKFVNKLHVVCCMLYVVCCMLYAYVVTRMSHVVFCMLYVVCGMWYVV